MGKTRCLSIRNASSTCRTEGNLDFGSMIFLFLLFCVSSACRGEINKCDTLISRIHTSKVCAERDSIPTIAISEDAVIEMLKNRYPLDCRGRQLGQVVGIDYAVLKDLNALIALFSDGYKSQLFVIRYSNASNGLAFLDEEKDQIRNGDIDTRIEIIESVKQNVCYVFTFYVIGMKKLDNLIVYKIGKKEGLEIISPMETDILSKFSGAYIDMKRISDNVIGITYSKKVFDGKGRFVRWEDHDIQFNMENEEFQEL